MAFIREAAIYFSSNFLRGRSLLPPKPQLSLADTCNFKCEFCWVHSTYAKNSNNTERLLFKERPPQILEWQGFLKIADALAEANTHSVVICGKGEPLLNPKAVEMLAYLREKRINFSLTTNGALLTPELGDELLKIGPSAINISLDSLDPENYLKIHGILAPKLEEVINNIVHLRTSRDSHNYRTRIEVSFVISKLNLHEIHKISEVAPKFADHIKFINCIIYPEIAHLALSREDYFKLAKIPNNPDKSGFSLRSNWQEFIHKVERATANPNYLKDYFSCHPCKVPYSFCVIHADGRVTPCCPSSYVVGNAIERGFKEIWNSHKFNSFRVLAYRLPKLKKELPYSCCYSCGHF